MKTLISNQTGKNSFSLKVILSMIFLCVLVVVVLNIRALEKSISPHGLGLSDEMIRYESPSGQYSMLVSTKWIILDFSPETHKNTDLKTSIHSPYSSLEIQVSSKYIDSNLLDDLVDWKEVETEERTTNYREISTSKYSNEKQNGILLEYLKDMYDPIISFYWNSKERHCVDYYFIEEYYGYKFSFCSVEKTWREAEELFMVMINSIEIIK